MAVFSRLGSNLASRSIGPRSSKTCERLVIYTRVTMWRANCRSTDNST